MGVDRTDYLIWAYDVGYKNVNCDDFENEIDGTAKKRFDMIYDGMCGQYALAGKVVAESEPYEGFTSIEVVPKISDEEQIKIAMAVSEAVGKEISRHEFKMMLFSHFH